MAQTPLEQFCIEHSLILVGQLARWRDECPKVPFEDMLLRNHTIVSETNWLDELFSIDVKVPVLPPTDTPRLPISANSAKGNKLREDHQGIIIQDSPILVVATYNPFNTQALDATVPLLFPGVKRKIVLVTPHTYSKLAALAERGACTFTADDWKETLPDWCASIGQPDEGFLDLGMLIEEIWSNPTTPTPVLLPGQYTAGVSLGDMDAILVSKTRLHAWIATPRPYSVELYNNAMQKVGLTIHILAVGPNEFKRLKIATEKPRSAAADVTKENALHIRDWGSPADENELARRIVQAAIEMGASDIHIDPKETRARIRFRVDNELFEQSPIPNSSYLGVMKRLKIMGVMMQDKTGLLQDGAGNVEFNGTRYDLRFSISVVNGGKEAVVIRIFNARIPDLADLRLKENEMKVLKWFLDQENGMVVCSGPTGSGKTTLLYALLAALDDPSLDIVTIEQPSEKHFENAKQITVYESGKLTYGTALRSILRQDPDVIMIGEIRDDESAVKGVEAAMTGHLVLTTTHANSAVGVIERLCGSFPVDRVALATVLKLSIAQRLVGRLCPLCKIIRAPRADDLEFFPPIEIARPIIAERSGCSACRGTGLAGRLLVMEIMPVDDTIREMIAARRAPQEIERYNRLRGFTGIIEQATHLLQTGEIPIESARQFITRPLV